MSKQKVILAYSGGLDTSVILKWLLEQGYEVFAYMANIGQQEDFDAAREKALKIGASDVFIEDMRKELSRIIFSGVQGQCLYEGRYLLGTAIARPLIAKKQIEIAENVGAAYVSHGATGKGNDQVRFELSYYALNPKIKIISPWKDKDFLAAFKGRTDLLAYAEKHGIPTKQTASKPYSEDDNLLHISHEAGILEDPAHECDETIYSHTTAPENSPDIPVRIRIRFKDGIPVEVENLSDGTLKTDALELFEYLNHLGSEHGIGRLDMVENRFVGIKSRGVYETPGGSILHEAHKDIEGMAMDREVMRLRDMLAAKLGELVYNGFWFSPEMEFIMAAMDKSQELIDGDVILKLYKGRAYPVARTSPSSLYNQDLSSMDIEGGYNQEDAGGFIRINAIRLMAHRRIVNQ